MSRPTKCREICVEPAYDKFRPEGIPTGEKINMTLDEYETIRLIDFNKYTHEQCSKQMGISRTTVTEIYETARYKLADAVVNGKQLEISGGNYRFCDGKDKVCCKQMCKRAEVSVRKNNYSRKGESQMRVAVTYENGEVFQHFGHTEQFKLYDIENGEIKNTQIIDTNGQGHGALASFLKKAGADTVICGGIGAGAQNALSAGGIQLYGGVTGNADVAVQKYMEGTLDYNPAVKCTHHKQDENHSCGNHHCGEDKHGCSGNGEN